MRISDWSSDVCSSDLSGRLDMQVELADTTLHVARKLRAYSQQVPDIVTLSPLECRSEEHTSELQSLMRISYAVFCLKKKNKNHTTKDNEKTERAYMLNKQTIKIILSTS